MSLLENQKSAKRTITLTNDQWSEIGFCIKQYAKEVRTQIDFWRQNELEILPDGKPLFEDADMMVKYWSEQLATLEAVYSEIEPGLSLFLDFPQKN